MTDEEIKSVARERMRWRDMQHRCRNNAHYADVEVCEDWLGEDGFVRYYRHVSQLEHFGDKDYTLDRIDVYGNYEPGNVRWATKKTQVVNRRCTVRDHGQTLEDISIESGLPIDSIRRRWYEEGSRGDRLRRPLYTKKDAYSNELTRLPLSKENSTEKE